MSNTLSIIGGKWRSRVLTFPDTPTLRPTPARVRETLFNWLQYDLAGSRCLDLYAGSGALGFEAASRGANQVVQVENNTTAIKALHKNINKLSADQITVVQADVCAFLNQQSEPFDLIFLDPPFGQNLIADTCHLLNQQQWLADSAKIYIESERQHPLTGLPDNWQKLKQKQAGHVSYQLFSQIV